jgi:hypothetical protein
MSKVLLRSEALQAGLTRYFTGQPCMYGHICERMVSSKRCCECGKAAKAAWDKANLTQNAAARRRRVAARPEHYKALKAAWHKANPEGQAARSRKWYLANKEKADAASKKWIEENQGRVNARAARLRAEQLQRTAPWADLSLIDDIYSLARVLREHGLPVEVDHEIPLRGKKVSGLHTHHNLRLLDSTQNKSKSNRFNVN